MGDSFGGGFSFCRDDRKYRYFRNLSQQVLSGVVGVTDFVLLTDPFRNRVSREARVAQWRERSPPTNVVRVRILASTPYVG